MQDLTLVIPAKFESESLPIFLNEISDILSDDLNTPEAFRYLSALAKHAKKNKNDRHILNQASMLLGINLNEPKKQQNISNEFRRKIELLIVERNKYRNSGQFDKADDVRSQLSELGVTLEDSKGKTVWKLDTDKN